MRLPVTEKLRLYWKWLEIGSGTTDDGTIARLPSIGGGSVLGVSIFDIRNLSFRDNVRVTYSLQCCVLVFGQVLSRGPVALSEFWFRAACSSLQKGTFGRLDIVPPFDENPPVRFAIMMATVSNTFVCPVTSLMVIFGSDLSLSGGRQILAWGETPLNLRPFNLRRPRQKLKMMRAMMSELQVYPFHKFPTST